MRQVKIDNGEEKNLCRFHGAGECAAEEPLSS